MTERADHLQMPRIINVISPIEEDDAGARAHTRTRNAIAHDIDRIEAARLAALKLCFRLNLNAQDGWVHYCDSVGGIWGEQA